MALTVLHVSDLHLTDNFYLPKTRMVKRHDPKLLDTLALYWKSQQIQYLVATGDIATDGQTQSFENAKNFFLTALPAPSTGWNGSAKVGLELGTYDRLFFVPGNHDRFRSGWVFVARHIENFEGVFGAQFHNVGRPRNAGWMKSGDIRIRVLMIDSMGAAGATVAKGKIHEDDLQWLQTMYVTDKQNSEQCDLRILLVHHHVALPPNRKFKRATKLKNVDEAIIAMLRADIDIAMFGHEHYHYLGERTYSDLIGDRRKCHSLEKNGYQVEKRLITCMCGTTSLHDHVQNLAWRLTIEKRAATEFSLGFKLLEVTKSGRLDEVPGESRALRLTRRSSQQVIGYGF